MSRWNFIAQRATTGEFLHWDLPLTLDSLEWQLSGAGSLRAKVTPEDAGRLIDESGNLLLEEWGTLIFAEADGAIRWGGVLISLSVEGEDLELEAAGYSTYSHRRIYRGEYSQIGIDPFEVFQHIWTHIQTVDPRGNLNLAVTGTSTPVRMGTAAWTETTTEADGTARTQEHDAEPYELLWYDHPNCGEELDNLTKQTPFDWIEKHYWAPGGREQIVHEIQVAYPRLGRLREDLSFVQGANVTNVVVIDSNGDEFANNIIGLGAGEGQAMLRRSTADADDRLVVDYVYADKAVTDPARLDALIAEELNLRKAALRITSIDVKDHPNARLGSWELGDDVIVRAKVAWLGEVSLRVRITGWALTGADTATLDVERSDFYRYGGTE